MPIIKSAKKKLKQDKKRRILNLRYLKSYRAAINKLKTAKTAEKIAKMVNLAYSKIDKAAKKNVIHKNKAARLKAAIAKFLKPVKKTKTKK